MAVLTYDPAKVTINFGGVPISGYTDGEFATVSSTSDQWTTQVGADGEVSRSKSNDYTDEITLTLKASSQSNLYMSTVFEADRTANTGKLPFSIIDLSGTTLLGWDSAWIAKVADVGFSKENGERAWTIRTGQRIVSVIGGNNE